jgi:transposase
VRLDDAGLQEIKARMGQDCEVVLEASTHSARLYDELKGHARAVWVAHPAQTRGASSLHVKTDLRDAEVLARMLATGFIRPVWVPERDCRSLRNMVAYRQVLSRLHTETVNRLRSHLRSELLECPHPSLFSRLGRGWLESVVWPDPRLALLTSSLLRLRDALKLELHSIDDHLARW